MLPLAERAMATVTSAVPLAVGVETCKLIEADLLRRVLPAEDAAAFSAVMAAVEQAEWCLARGSGAGRGGAIGLAFGQHNWSRNVWWRRRNEQGQSRGCSNVSLHWTEWSPSVGEGKERDANETRLLLVDEQNGCKVDAELMQDNKCTRCTKASCRLRNMHPCAE
jgi:hypothetical protein